MRPAPVHPWSVAIAAVSGGILGILTATAYHLLHDHMGLPYAALLGHFVPQLIAGLLSGALVFGWAAAIHNRKWQAGRSDMQPRSPWRA